MSRSTASTRGRYAARHVRPRPARAGRRRLVVRVAPLVTLLAILGLAAPAAAVTLNQKLGLMSEWSQPTAASYNAWNRARQTKTLYAMYQFDWITDNCSVSPDRPLGFDFSLACQRHDFGYRNYKANKRFAAHKARLDDAFHADLTRVCTLYNRFRRPACYVLAWAYYKAVRVFGSFAIEVADIEQARALDDEGQKQQARAGEG